MTKNHEKDNSNNVISSNTNNILASSSSQENKTPRDTFQANKSKTFSNDIYFKYSSDLKSKFKIAEDSTNIKHWEIFYNELMIKISSYKNQAKSFENSNNIIDKIKQVLSCKEITNDTIILRECELTADRFYFMVTKKTFDFKNIILLNLSKNQLGDIGGCYVLYLIDLYSTRLDYLNLSSNRLGKQSTDILTNILQKNNCKINTLNISFNQIGDKNFSEICLGISKNNYLTKLFTADNELGKISSIILGTVLRYDKKIKLLDISKNYIDDVNIPNTLKGLISNGSLETLILNENNLTNKTFRTLETTLSINTTLREIFLEKNKFNNKGCELLTEILNKNNYLEVISLVGNKISHEGVDIILEKQRKVGIKIISKTDYYQGKISEDNKINLYDFF